MWARHVSGADAVWYRARKTRGHTAEATNSSPVTAQPQDRTPETPGAFNGQPDGSPQAGGAVPANSRSSRRALKNWRLRSRLLLLITIPTLTAAVLGGIRITSSLQSALSYQRVQTLASLGQEITVLAQALQDERDQAVFYIALGKLGGRADGMSTSSAVRSKAALDLAVIGREYSSTDLAASQVRATAGQIGSAYSVQTQQEAATALTALGELKTLRNFSIGTQLPALVVVQKYTQVIDDVLVLNNEIAQGVSDPTLAQTVRVLALVSAMKEEASEQRAILAAALLQGSFGPGQLAAIEAAQSAQQSNLAAFNNSATVGERLICNQSVDQSFVYLASSEELQAISLQNSVGSLSGDPTTPVDWFGAMSNTIDFQMGSVEHQLGASVISRSASLHNSAITSAIIDSLVVALLFAIALVSTTIVARSMVRPLRRLRAGALEVAGVRLPEAVRRMSEADGEGMSLEVEPIDVDSSDEIGEVARAFDQVHREALRLAANEAALRGNVNAMFVNLSRRSQSLVERQLRLIDDLEQGEQDPERLSSLFQMDHLATRMRRNSENLLVLAGHDETRRWNQPVALVDVLRAALSEIEHYERVTLNVQPGIAVRGQAVSDVVHLTAELVENATLFSAVETPVTIAGHLLSSGGALLEITDQGVGMGAEEMAHANWRLDNPPVVDVAVSRRMGLFVVGRLAAKHGIRVRLRPADSGGLIAMIWLPDETIMQESPGTPAALRGFDAATPKGAAGPVADAATVGGWGDVGRAAAAQEVSAARTPRFAPLRADVDETALGPRRVPRLGPRPGSDSGEAAATGPLPAFGTVPRPASESRPRPAATGPQPEVGAGGEPTAEPETAAADAVAATYEPFGTGLHPVGGTAASSFDTGSPSVLGASEGRAGALVGDDTDYHTLAGLDRGSDGGESDSSRSDVIVPSAEDLGEGNRLPIFEAVESDWFRRGRPAVGRSGHEEKASNGWVSVADEGWRAAEVVHAPSSGGVTAAGLPKRVPQANLVPGAASGGSAPGVVPTRSAATTRDRFASFQRGIRKGRAAAAGDGPGGGEDGAGGGEGDASR
jgi:hypothetical protein